MHLEGLEEASLASLAGSYTNCIERNNSFMSVHQDNQREES